MRNGINRSSDKGYWKWLLESLKNIPKNIPKNKFFIRWGSFIGGIFVVVGSLIFGITIEPILLLLFPMGVVVLSYGVYLIEKKSK